MSTEVPSLDYVSGNEFHSLLDRSLSAFREELSPFLAFESQYRIRRGADITPFIHSIAEKDAEVAEIMSGLKTAAVVEVEDRGGDTPEGLHDRAILLLEDTQGQKASVTVALYGTAPGIEPAPGDEFNPLVHKGHFGGMGLYGRKFLGLPPLIDAIIRAEGLAKTMKEKAVTCGFEHLAGSKTIVSNLSEDGRPHPFLNPAFLLATGMAFSKIGPKPFNGIITGDDVGQTQETVDWLGRGSQLADPESYNIVGTTERGFPDTGSYVKYSLWASYEALQAHQREFAILPPIADAVVSISGLGNVGFPTLEGFLEAKGRKDKKVYIADLKLDDGYPDQIKAQELQRRIEELQNNHPNAEIIIVNSADIPDREADVFVTCTDTQGIVDRPMIDRLKASNVKMVLAAANNFLSDQEVAEYAFNTHNIIMLPETVTNNGSATAAGLEPEFLYQVARGNYQDSQAWIEEVLVPRIKKQALDNVVKIEEAYYDSDGAVSLYALGKRKFAEAA